MSTAFSANSSVRDDRRLSVGRWLKIVALAIVTSTSGVALNAMAASMPSRPVEMQAQVKSAPRLLGGPQVARTASVHLGPLNEKERMLLRDPAAQTKAYQMGVGRTLNKAQAQVDLQSLAWLSADDGTRYATLEFESSYAAALRLGIASAKFPAGVTLYVYGTYLPELVYGPYTTKDFRTTGRPSDTFWLPTIEGDTVRVELQVARGLNLDQLAIAVPAISHLTKSVRRDAFKNLADIGDAGFCNIDIACPPSTATWVTRGQSVAKYYFTDSGGVTYICTGTLINSNSGAAPPPNYFITARHCIGTVAEASSMHFYWFFQRMTCGGANPTAPLAESTGATFINAVIANDATLVRLDTTPPAGTSLAAWTTTPLITNEAVVALHHPLGDLKKFSAGTQQGFASYLNDTLNNSASHVRVRWNTAEGTTEGGSSGSSLFNSNGEIVGTLTGGGASCTTPTNPDWYGRFDQAYSTLQPWLTPGPGGPPPPQPPPVPPSTALTSGVPVSNSVLLAQDIWYRIQTASNTTSVTVTLTNLSADADLYVFRDSQNSAPACFSEALNTDNESCTITVTGGSTIYIDVYGYRAANYTVTATLVSPAPPLGNDVAARDGGGGGGALEYALLALLGALLGLHLDRAGRFRPVLTKQRLGK